jgi:hypothetical protein
MNNPQQTVEGSPPDENSLEGNGLDGNASSEDPRGERASGSGFTRLARAYGRAREHKHKQKTLNTARARVLQSTTGFLAGVTAEKTMVWRCG